MINNNKFILVCLLLLPLLVISKIQAAAQNEPYMSNLKQSITEVIKSSKNNSNKEENLKSILFFIDQLDDHLDNYFDQQQDDIQVQESNNNQDLLERKPDLICRTCENIFSHLNTKNITHLSDIVQNFVIYICNKLQLTQSSVCQGSIQEFTPIILKQIQQRFSNPFRACPFLKLCRKYYEKVNIKKVVKNILKDKPENVPVITPTLRKTYKLLHITDIHMDFWYIPFSNALCEYPLCCRNQTAQPQYNPNQKQKPEEDYQEAGYWGTLGKCDIPQHTLQQFVNYLNKEQDLKIDLGFWGGDTAAHNIWNQGVQSNINHTLVATQMFKELPFNFVPIMGNHECFPVNMYEFDSDRELDLKYSFANAWQYWIGEDAADQIRSESFYSYFAQEIGARVIGLTTESCNPLNFFLVSNPTDPGKELQWLYNVLLKAEQNKEAVFIISHIPVNDCLQKWAEVFNAIVERFSNTIRAQLYGHTHHDQFLVIKGHKKQPVGVQFIAPSMTTEGSINPSFRVYEVDADTLLPLNYYQYRLNITYWNKQYPDVQEISWDIAYNAKDEYEMDNIYDVNQWQNLAERIKNDKKTYDKYLYNYFTGTKNFSSVDSIDKSYYCDTKGLPNQVSWCKLKYNPQSLIGEIEGHWIEIKK